jgi:predicted dienelactone hydrolase
MRGLEMLHRISLMALGCLSTTILSGCGSGSSAPPLVISVSFPSGSSQTITQGQSTTITVSISNDPSGKGVTWKLTGPGALSNQTNISVEYDAPTNVASTTTATVTATAVADPTKSAPFTVTVTPPPISITVSPNTVTMAANTTQQFTATVQDDSANKGVTWTISPSSGAGTLSNATSTSVTYASPASPPASDLNVTITAISVADPSKSSTASITVGAIQVTINQGNPTVMAGTALAFTVTVRYDPSNSGVTWSIAPASGAGTLSDATTSSVTYHAPPDSPASNLPVTLTATSVADHSKSGTANIIVPAISVFVSPGSALIPINATQQFTATINFDPKVQGASWAPIQGAASCGLPCGTFAPTTTASGTATTYTAPATLPTNGAVAITATSVTDLTKSASAAITLTNGTVKLVPANLNFGNVKAGKSRSLTVSLTNTGKTTLNISSMTTARHFTQTNDCGATVGAGVSCTVTVTFGAPGSGGTENFTGTLTINDSSADSPQTVSLSGTGLEAHPESIPSALAAERSVTTPTPTGPSDVGTRVVDLLDSTRDDASADSGSKRELLVRFWYPATLRQDCKPAEYASPAVWSYFSQLVGVPLPEVRTNSCQDAAIENGAHPVVVFTPGYTATFTDYTFLFEDLASRGYVVASVDHTNEATAVEFPDGRLVKSFFGSHLGNRLRTDEDAYTSAVSERLSDLKFVITELGHLNNAPKGPFAGKLDTSRVAVAGHSLGGLTALLGIEQDPRFRAGIVLDGVAPDRVVNETEIPVFILITGRQQWSVDECRLWSNLRGPRLGVNLPGAGHLAPSDAVWLTKGMVKTGGMSPEKTVAVLRNYVAAFLDANLRGQPINSLLTGPSAYFPDVVVTTQRQSACSEK